MSNYAKSRGIAGIIINPGDIIVGDSDGIIAIDPKNAAELAKAYKERKLQKIAVYVPFFLDSQAHSIIE